MLALGIPTEFVERLGWVFAHFLWQGLLLSGSHALLLSLFRVENPRSRYSIGLTVLGLFAALTTVTFFVGEGPGKYPQLAPLLTGLGFAWLVGASVLAVLFFAQLGYAELHQFGGTKSLPPECDAACRRLAQKCNASTKVRFVESTLVQSPATIGWLRPLVLIPPNARRVLSQPELEAILLHELAHLRRADFLARLAQAVVETLLFFHPVVWFTSHCINAERERCCDDFAVEVCRDAHTYATALFRLEEERLRLSSLAMQVDDQSLRARVERLLGVRSITRYRINDWRIIMSSAALAVALLVGFLSWHSAPGLSAPAGAESRLTAAHPPRPNVPIQLHLQEFEYESPTQFQLPVGGRIAFRTTVLKRIQSHRRQSFTVHSLSQGTVAIQLIPLTDGFEPLLVAAWPCLHGPDHTDGDFKGGRGLRPFHRIVCSFDPPRNWVRFDVCAFHDVEQPKMPMEEADYVAIIWQPRTHNDLDPDVIGPESTPVVLDDSGRGNPHIRDEHNPPPTLDYAGDIDTFQVRSISRRPLRITVDGTKSNLVALLRVYDDTGDMVVSTENQQQTRLTIRSLIR